MKFGFVLPNNFGIDDVNGVVDLAAQAEQLGYSSVYVNHHVLNVGYIAARLDDRPYHDALTVLTAAAERTEWIRLGTSVLVMPYLHPMSLAKALATLDHLSGGRVIAGLGVGSLPEENEILGVPYADRGRWSDEFIEVMRALWSPGPATIHGDVWFFDDVVASPKPLQDSLPILIGGSGGPAQRRAARVGDIWHPMCTVEGLARRMPGFEERLAAHGRSRTDIAVAPRIDARSAADAAAVREWASAGADELVVSVASGDLEMQRSELERVAALID